MQKVRQQKIHFLWLFVSARFQDLFTSILRMLFTFPSRYYISLSVLKGSKASRMVPRSSNDLTRPTFVPRIQNNHTTGLLPSSATVSSIFICFFLILFRHQPLPAFARHYLRGLGWFLFLQLLRCFTSLGFTLLDGCACTRSFPPITTISVQEFKGFSLSGDPSGLGLLISHRWPFVFYYALSFLLGLGIH
jgi:hypothetical protein